MAPPPFKLSAPKSPRQYHEARLQRAVVGWLRIAGVPGLLFFHVANEGQRSARAGAFLKTLGLRAGVADLVVIPPGGKAHFLEVKVRGEKQSPEQVAFAADCAACGCPYEIADNIDSVITILRSWQAISADMSGKWGYVPKRGREPKVA